jgi:hypothetical protein
MTSTRSAGASRDDARVAPIYSTGHRNPDTDSIAAAVVSPNWSSGSIRRTSTSPSASGS